MTVSEAQPLILKHLLRLLRRSVGVFLPPRCLGCGLVVEQDDSLCPACWGRLKFIAAPRCAACGVPFEIAQGEDALCAPCLERQPRFAEARAAVVYDRLPREVLMRFKYGSRPHLARMMARHIRLMAADWLDAQDAVLVPVPLARWRLWRRGYNQAGLIAGALARGSAAGLALGGLVRHRATQSSGGLTRAQRFANVRGAFSVPEDARYRMAGRTVILVDDVMTTGATADACAHALIRAGAARVRVLTWARALPG